MKKMKAGEISPGLMPPMIRWSYGRSTNEEITNERIRERVRNGRGDVEDLRCICKIKDTMTPMN